MKLVLHAEGLNKSYGHGRSRVDAVKNVDLMVQPGEVVLIMGPSGSGKTTLLSMLGSLLTPDSGQIFYGKQDITTIPKRKLPALRSKHLGFVFQSFNLIPSLNVWENVAVVLELLKVDSKKARQRAKLALGELGLGERLDYDIKYLSGGEKQRVSVARALVNDPKLILADEPTANLDSASGHKVTELIGKIASKDGKAVIIVSHDTRIKDIADRVLWLEDGQITEEKRSG